MECGNQINFYVLPTVLTAVCGVLHERHLGFDSEAHVHFPSQDHRALRGGPSDAETADLIGHKPFPHAWQSYYAIILNNPKYVIQFFPLIYFRNATFQHPKRTQSLEPLKQILYFCYTSQPGHQRNPLWRRHLRLHWSWIAHWPATLYWWGCSRKAPWSFWDTFNLWAFEVT